MAIVGVIGMFCGPLNFHPDDVTEINNRHVMTFKNEECEALASESALELFGNGHKFLKNIGVMIVEHDSESLSEIFALDTEFEDCVKTLEKD